jgi:thiol-disulfide isomerase/thioredoxin
MDTPAALGVLAALIAVSTALGVVWRSRTGRLTHGAGRSQPTVAAGLEGFGPLGASATLLQFSTEVCAPCHATRKVLATIAERTPGVEHLEVNVAHAPELAARFRVTQAPTTFLIDGDRIIRARIAGAPNVGALTARLAEIVRETQPHA